MLSGNAANVEAEVQRIAEGFLSLTLGFFFLCPRGSVTKRAVSMSKLSAFLVLICLCFVNTVGAITLEMTDGSKTQGEVILAKPDGLQIRVEGNKYEKLEWSKFTQATLTELKKDPKLAPFVEPYIEVPLDEKIKKTEVTIKEVPRLERPHKSSIFGAMFSSSVGIICLMLLYGANIYAGYEVATVRAYPAAMVCGIAAIAPIIGPIIFLCLPTKMGPSQDDLAEEQRAATEELQAATYGETAAPQPSSSGSESGKAHESHASHSAAVPQTQSFKRGQFTFNRRFIETKFAGFFGMVRKDAEKDLLLIIKSARGEFSVTRISEIGATDMKVDVHSGGASQQTMIPFVEILEMQIKHKDA